MAAVIKRWYESKPLIRDLCILIAILIPAFVLLIGIRPLSVPDEGRYPEVAREMLLTGDFITPKVNGIVFLDKPALYYWLEAGAMKVFGVHAWSIRLMPSLLGAFGVVVIFLTAHRLFSRRAAWWSVAALATNPLYFLASQYADMNIEIAVWVTCALCGFLSGRSFPIGSYQRRVVFSLSWLAIGLGVLTKGLIGLVFPALIVGAWVVIGWRWRELRHWYFISGAGLALLACLPWFIAVQRANPEFLHYFFVYQQFERFTSGGFNNAQPFWFYVPIVLIGSLPWCIWLPACLREQFQRARSSDVSEQRDIRQLLLLWPLLVLIFFSIPASKIVGYIVPVLPPLSLMLGDYFARRFPEVSFFANQSPTIKPQGRRWLQIQSGIGIAIIVAAIVGATTFDRTGASPIAKTLKQEMSPTDQLIGYRHYAQDIPIYLQLLEPMPVVEDWGDERILQSDDWRREFYLSAQHHAETDAWLIDESEFAQRLRDRKPSQRVFVLARKREAEKLTRQHGLRELKSAGKQVLLVTP